MAKITFLSASLPLTKTIERLADGTIFKTPYPLVSNFTSKTRDINTIDEFYKALVTSATSARKPCLLKGEITRELSNESRKGTTRTNDPTSFICLDLDRASFSTPAEVMRVLGMDDISYVVQYSASYMLDRKDKRLSCHIFIMLDKPKPAPQLKAWLMHLNLSTPVLEKDIELSTSGAALHWPLDITCCQNDKLIYTAMPVFKNMQSPIKEADRIQLIKKDKAKLSVDRLDIKQIEPLKTKAREKLNALRDAAGIKPLRGKTRMVGEFEVQSGVGEISTYEVFDCGEFNRLNLNGGDSQAYWHSKSDLTYLHNFKGEPSLPLKEVLPHYYADLMRNGNADSMAPDTGGKVEILAFRDKVTAEYWKGTFDPTTQTLEIYTVKNEKQLDDFLQSHNKSLGAFVPEFHRTFDPHNPVIYDVKGKTINTYIPTKYSRAMKKNASGEYPIIQSIIDSCVGKGEVQEHFLNWLAVVWQQRRKPLTAWVLHGVEGTGKGLLFNNVLVPLFGREHAIQKRASELNSEFNGWVERALVCMIDEIDAEMFLNSRSVEANLRTLITEPVVSVRRMRTDSYLAPNYTAFIFSSNKKRPVAIPPGDRRFNVGLFQNSKLLITPQEVDAIEDELEGFAHMLSTREASFEDARRVLDTEDRRAVQRLSTTSIDSLAGEILNGNFMTLWDALPDEKFAESNGMVDGIASAYSALIKRMATEAISRITRDELILIFRHCIGKVPEGSKKQAQWLEHHGIVLSRLRDGDARIPGVEIEWRITPEQCRTIRAEVTGTPTKSTKVRRVK